MKTVFAIAALVAGTAHAATDAGGDFLASFTGTPVAALDLLAADVSFDAAANTFTLHAHSAGPIAGAPGVAFVFGFDRGGSANAPFGAIGFPDVRFNATATLRADGTGVAAGAPLTVAIGASDIFGVVPAALLPGQAGVQPAGFTWALWAIDTRITGAARNADFIGSGNFAVASAVPEPGSVALLAAGLAVVGGIARRRNA